MRDFNTPQLEFNDWTIITWGQRSKHRKALDPSLNQEFIIRKNRGSRWDEGERNVLSDLKEKNLTDIFRKLHGYAKEDYSWFVNHGSTKRGRRFDHIFASEKLKPVKCFYDHDVRERGLSDHSAMIAEFEIDV